MRLRISIRGRVRPSVGPSVRPSVGPVLFSKVKNTHTRRILCRVSGLVCIERHEFFPKAGVLYVTCHAVYSELSSQSRTFFKCSSLFSRLISFAEHIQNSFFLKAESKITRKNLTIVKLPFEHLSIGIIDNYIFV